MRNKIETAPILLQKLQQDGIIDCDEMMAEIKCRDQSLKRGICELRDQGYLINTIESNGKCYYKLVSNYKDGAISLKDHKIGALAKYLQTLKVKDTEEVAKELYKIAHSTREDLWKYTYSVGRLEQRKQIGELIEQHGGVVESITLDIESGKFVVIAKNKAGKDIKAEINAVR